MSLETWREKLATGPATMYLVPDPTVRAELLGPNKDGRRMQYLQQNDAPIWIDDIWIEGVTNRWYRRYLTPDKSVFSACVQTAGDGKYEYNIGRGWGSFYESFEDAAQRCEVGIWRVYAPAPKESA